MAHPITLIGHEGSPYSRKLRAVCRYRHIPFHWVADMGPEFENPPPLKVKLLPIVVEHDNEGKARAASVDTTPLIRRFEQEHPQRAILPPDPAVGFLNALIEDYADEWCTKFMFHFRWRRQVDIDWAGLALVTYINPAVPPATVRQMADAFAERQISRLWVVGSNDQTAAVIEPGYERVLERLTHLLEQRLFLFGNRPSSADFGLFGQFCQLCEFDPTPMAIAREKAPRVVAWCRRLEDLSGWRVAADQWLDREVVAVSLSPLLEEIGRTYVPFMLANARALMAGDKNVSCDIEGTTWEQQTFPYQGKCVQALREHFQSLAAEDQAWLRDLLDANGCGALVSDVPA